MKSNVSKFLAKLAFVSLVVSVINVNTLAVEDEIGSYEAVIEYDSDYDDNDVSAATANMKVLSSRTWIKDFTISEIQNAMPEESLSDWCSLCSSDFDKVKVLLTTPCKHSFCYKCLKKHISDNNFFCPSCDEKFNPNKDAFVKSKSLSRISDDFGGFKIEINQKPDSLNDCCGICLGEFDGKKELLTTPCKHIFCYQCLKQCIVKYKNYFCPLCKSKLENNKDILLKSKNVEKTKNVNKK